MKFIFNSSVLKSKVYKPSGKWTWNIFAVRFWYEWTTVYKSERVMELIYSDYKLPPQMVKQTVENHRNFDPHGLLPEHINFTAKNAAYLEMHGYKIPKYNDTQISISSLIKLDDKSYNGSTITNNNQPLVLLKSEENNNVLLPQHSEKDIKLIPRESGGYDIETIQPAKHKKSEPMTYMEIVDTIPEYMKLSLFRPTPKHFDLVEFDDVVKAGFDLTNEQVDKKGRQLQICGWVTLIFFIMFSLFTIIAFLKFIIATSVTGQFEFSYLLSTMYLSVLTVLCGVIYVSYVHLYWQYCRNRFGSLFCFFKDILKNPIRVLPVPFIDSIVEVVHV